MAADFDLMGRRSRAVAELLTDADEAHVTCPRGTDFRARPDRPRGDRRRRRPARARRVRQPAVRRGLRLAARRRGDDRRALARDGRARRRARDAHGRGRPARRRQRRSSAARRRCSTAPASDGTNLAELGVGTNERATLTGHVLEDEKILGTVHVAFGASAGIGGTVSVPVHLDVLIEDATLDVGGTRVLDGGRFVLEVTRLVAVPNVSEGRDTAVLDAIGAAFARTPSVLHRSEDPDHHRAVFTLAGEPGRLHRALAAGARRRPRGSTCAHTTACTRASARSTSRRSSTSTRRSAAPRAPRRCCPPTRSARAGIPVFLYGELARRPHARRAAPGRARRAGGARRRRPTSARRELHPTAGATLVAARPPLIAFNVELAPPATLADARAIAAAIRDPRTARRPRARPAAGRQDVVQVSTNIEDHRA